MREWEKPSLKSPKTHKKILKIIDRSLTTVYINMF